MGATDTDGGVAGDGGTGMRDGGPGDRPAVRLGPFLFQAGPFVFRGYSDSSRVTPSREAVMVSTLCPEVSPSLIIRRSSLAESAWLMASS